MMPPRSERGLSAAAAAVATERGARSTMVRAPSGEADARIEPCIEQVDNQIGEHEDRDGEHDQGLRQGIVLILDRQHEQAADPIDVNTCSVTTSPPIRKANSMPIKVTTGSSAFLSACRLTISRSTRPFARAVRI